MVQFAEKQVNDLFNVITSKAIDAGSLNLLSTKNKYEFIGRSIGNNSIQGYLSDETKPYFEPNEANTITISQIGQQVATYHANKYYASQNMFVLNPINFKLNRTTGLYFVTIFNCQLKQYLGAYTSYPTQNNVRQWKIQVPVTATGALDTDYMASYVHKIEASYVRKIEASYVRKIEAYLSVLGYKSMADVKLTELEKQLLAGGIQAQPTSKFRVGDLLEFHGIPQAEMQGIIPTDNTKAGIPYVVQSINNNMVSRFVNKKYIIYHGNPLENGDAIVLGVTLPAVSYQVHEFSGSQLIVGRLKSKYPKLNAKIGNYLVTILDNQMYQFSYAKKPGIKVYKRLFVKLPVTSSGDPNWQFMEDYITAIEKLKVLKLKQFLDHKLNLYQYAIK